nr:MAG TPA: hypothetical protein [Caudoviricetes sp.]
MVKGGSNLLNHISSYAVYFKLSNSFILLCSVCKDTTFYAFRHSIIKQKRGTARRQALFCSFGKGAV